MAHAEWGNASGQQQQQPPWQMNFSPVPDNMGSHHTMIHHRIGPTSSGISLRALPQTSLQEVARICQHYEAKAGGTSEQGPAARLLFDMSREVQSQLSSLDSQFRERENKYAALASTLTVSLCCTHDSNCHVRSTEMCERGCSYCPRRCSPGAQWTQELMYDKCSRFEVCLAQSFPSTAFLHTPE